MRPALLPLLVLVACSSSQSNGPQAKVPTPQFAIEQIFGPSDAGFPYGPLDVQYRFEIANRADEVLTLKRITISTVNPEGGAYTLVPPNDYYFNKQFAPRTTDALEFWAHAYAYGRSMRDTEPVTIKGVMYFQAASGGYVNQVFVRELGQQQ